MKENYSTPVAYFLWPGMPRAPEVTDRTESVLSRSYFLSSHAQNRFDAVRQKLPTFRLGPFELVNPTGPHTGLTSIIGPIRTDTHVKHDKKR